MNSSTLKKVEEFAFLDEFIVIFIKFHTIFMNFHFFVCIVKKVKIE